MNKTSLKIAVQPDFLALKRDPQQSFSRYWIEHLEQAGHEVCLANVFGSDFFDQIKGCDGFLWYFPPIPFPRDLGRRLMLALGHVSQMTVFPEWKNCWHFDDKVAQSYLLQAAGIPVPRTWVFWQSEDAEKFFSTATYPLVIKLRSGVYSQNVRLLRNRAEAGYWIRHLFNEGLLALERPTGSLLRRGAKRLRGALRILGRGHGPSIGGLDFHKDYLLVQEFIPENDFDTRITVIGKRAFVCRRYNRPDDFRASGSGILDRDPSLTDSDTVRFAYRVAETLSAQTICLDILRLNGAPVVCEISYYFEGLALYKCPGHWELEGDPDTGQLVWAEGQIHPEGAILEDFFARLANSSAQAGILAVPVE